MRPPATFLAVIVIAFAVSGCGGSKAESGSASRSTSAEPSEGPGAGSGRHPRKRKHVASIQLSSPGIAKVAGAGYEVGREYTCDGADRSPVLSWSGVPSSAAELAVFVVNVKPVNGKLFFDWAVAGLSPKLHGLQAGRLPAGTIVGRNGFGRAGYSICPSVSVREQYVFAIYAPTERVAARPGFEPLAVRTQVARNPRGDGLLIAGYARG